MVFALLLTRIRTSYVDESEPDTQLNSLHPAWQSWSRHTNSILIPVNIAGPFHGPARAFTPRSIPCAYLTRWCQIYICLRLFLLELQAPLMYAKSWY